MGIWIFQQECLGHSSMLPRSQLLTYHMPKKEAESQGLAASLLALWLQENFSKAHSHPGSRTEMGSQILPNFEPLTILTLCLSVINKLSALKQPYLALLLTM